MSQATEEFLEHHGVKGMQWGVRKGDSGGKPSSSKRKKSGDAKKVSELKKKKPFELTNKQLKTANERMNLEQNFKRMNPNKAKQGKLAVEAILATAALGVTAYNLVNSPAGKAAIAAGKAALKKGSSVAA